MVRNNFRILLAEQKKKMSDVERNTGLSKVTIRSLYYETAKGIQFHTLGAICGYLNCDVGDLLVISESLHSQKINKVHLPSRQEQ